MFGVDFSAGTYTNVVWTRVRMSGRTFAYVQASDGVHGVHEFRVAWSQLRETGLLRGAWHGLRMSEQAVEQAVQFLKLVELHRGDLPPVLEVSDLELSAQTLDAIRTWISVVSSELEARHGQALPTILRLSSRVAARHERALADYPLWLVDHVRYEQPCDGAWDLHQYTCAVSGVPGGGAHAHLDKFNVLKLFDRGHRVARVKQRMTEVGFGFGVTESDELDLATRDAVIRFQAARGLVQDGLIGPKTFAELQWP
jgi:GH25 family lysozyme M1 (1,4-beta-N-acetylmuramidase)